MSVWVFFVHQKALMILAPAQFTESSCPFDKLWFSCGVTQTGLNWQGHVTMRTKGAQLNNVKSHLKGRNKVLKNQPSWKLNVNKTKQNVTTTTTPNTKPQNYSIKTGQLQQSWISVGVATMLVARFLERIWCSRNTYWEDRRARGHRARVRGFIWILSTCVGFHPQAWK